MAPTVAGTYHVVATSVADPNKKAVATITVVSWPWTRVEINFVWPAIEDGTAATDFGGEFSSKIEGDTKTCSLSGSISGTIEISCDDGEGMKATMAIPGPQSARENGFGSWGPETRAYAKSLTVKWPPHTYTLGSDWSKGYLVHGARLDYYLTVSFWLY